MKKYILILVVILAIGIVLSRCSTTKNSISDSAPSHTSRTSHDTHVAYPEGLSVGQVPSRTGVPGQDNNAPEYTADENAEQLLDAIDTDTMNWAEYTDDRYFFSFRYPPTWTLEQSDDGVHVTDGTSYVTILPQGGRGYGLTADRHEKPTRVAGRATTHMTFTQSVQGTPDEPPADDAGASIDLTWVVFGDFLEVPANWTGNNRIEFREFDTRPELIDAFLSTVSFPDQIGL